MNSPVTASALLIVLCIQTVQAQTDDRLSASVITSSQTTVNPPASPDHSSVMHLNAFRKGQGITINWSSETAGKNIRYVIESSADGSHFNPSATLTATRQKNYSYTDAVVGQGAIFYRIKMETAGVITDVSNSIVVTSVEDQPYSMYPNPTEGDVYADLFSDFTGQMMRIIVRDSEGKICLSKQIMVPEKPTSMRIVSGRDGLKPGIYQVSMAFKNKTFSQSVEVK